MSDASAGQPSGSEVSPALTAPMAQALDDVVNTPGGTPAMAVAIVQGDAAPWIHVRGHVRSDRDARADADTYFYIASQTKSFMGLLGATLDESGEFPLSRTLAEVWPGLRLPAPANPAKITMADLLSHQEGLSTDTLNVVTAYVRDVPASEYPQLLATEVESRTAGFRYANLGDLIYGAALEASTGRGWRDWLDNAVLHPLGLRDISSRTSSLPATRLAWSHQWDGARWRILPPKTDAVMHAAGGLVASPSAMARWMQLNLGVQPGHEPLAPSTLRRSHVPIATAGLADGEIDCSGYSLGWYSCMYRGEHALMHPGSYNGAVSVTVLVPSVRAGMTLLANSDSAMEGLQLEWMKAFIGLVTGHADDAARLAKAVATYPANVDARAAKRRKAIDDGRADPQWGGWAWKPSSAELQACAGSYTNRLYGTMQIQPAGHQLVAQIGVLNERLQPARPGLFAASSDVLAAPEPLHCDARTGRVTWRGQSFQKTH